MKIDITTSATVRPNILNKTFSSFRANLLNDNHEYRLIINIDPIGEKTKPKRVLKVARSHFSNIVHRIPKSPSFVTAVKWCWSQVDADWVLHLEDDWTMNKPVDLDQMIQSISKYDEFSSFGLSKMPLNKRRKKKGGLRDAAIVEVDRISLNPAFIRCDFAKQAAQLMSVKGNPEKQLRIVDPNCGEFIKATRHCVYIEQGRAALVTDIGRKWMEKSRLYTKKTGFTQWKAR